MDHTIEQCLSSPAYKMSISVILYHYNTVKPLSILILDPTAFFKSLSRFFFESGFLSDLEFSSKFF